MNSEIFNAGFYCRPEMNTGLWHLMSRAVETVAGYSVYLLITNVMH